LNASPPRCEKRCTPGEHVCDIVCADSEGVPHTGVRQAAQTIVSHSEQQKIVPDVALFNG
jgi:hypothetical protein